MASSNLIFVLLSILYSSVESQRMVGYDCGSRNLNVTTLSLLDVGQCQIPTENVEISEVYMQLLQVNNYKDTEVLQCKVEIFRSVYHCGMFSHVSLLPKGKRKYILEVGAATCREMHLTGTFNYAPGIMIQGLHVNATSEHSLDLGTIESDGDCDGIDYSDSYGTWKDAIVQGTITITLQTHTASVALDSNRIILNSGTTCLLNIGSCMDREGGNSFWAPIPKDHCKFDRYGILYEGYANKMVDSTFNDAQTVYTLSTQDVTFGLTAKGQENVCGYKIVRTEHPKLVVFETKKEESFVREDARVSVNNLDIFAYMNSKFVYVEKHMRAQMRNLYRDVVQQRCNLERQTLKNSLSIAASSPDEFAYHLMKGPGYMAVVAGEVVHIIKCVPVEVVIEHDEYCYAELQVSHQNSTYYLSPRTHILKRKGTQITCNALIPAHYRLGDIWLKIMPRPIITEEPTMIQPATKSSWKYVNPGNLATSGIYTEQDLNDLRDRIMFPVERPAILNDLAREMHGQPVADHDGSILRLLNEETVMKIAESAWSKMWNRFMIFGTFSAGVIAIIFILHLLKTVLDIVVRGYTLHAVFGWSLHLLGAFWSSVAHCLLISAQTQTPSPNASSRNQPKESDKLYPELSPKPTPRDISVSHSVELQNVVINSPKPQPGYSIIPQ